MANERVDKTKAHHFFYRDSYRKVVKALIVSLVIVLLLFFAILYVYMFLRPAERRYYATSTVGNLYTIHPVAPPSNQPKK